MNLRNLLLGAKMSENELARRTGISQQIINRILSGQNKNPKIATLSPLANYFMLSISQLIGEAALSTEIHTNPSHLGWEEIPMMDWDALKRAPLDELLSLEHPKIWIDGQPSQHMFAIILKGQAMEPKFTEGTILIFDAVKIPNHRDFILLRCPDGDIMVRQLWTKNKKAYQKAFNPRFSDYQLTPVDEHTCYLGTLIQSRTNHGSKALGTG
ncbi:MAG: LexA family transcriptional regulator [Legionellales bacterium]|nr:LexA family transcriptional regulator [Legionellales bacterium]